MDVEAFFEEMPFADLIGVELTDVGGGHAEGSVEMRPELSWNSEEVLAHGGVTFTLADTVGGAALVSLVDRPVPTVDMRIDYLAAARGDLSAEADVRRVGGQVGVVDVQVYGDSTESDADADTDADTYTGRLHAEARGVYKTGE